MARPTDRADSESAAAKSVPKRKPGRPKGTPASDKQKAASKENVKKALEARAKAKAERDALREDPDYKPRWQMLEDGDIDVTDLTLKECMRGQCANNDGSWDGKRHTLPPRIKTQMEHEWKRRLRAKFDRLAPKALKAFEDLIEDEDNPAQRWAATKFALEYQFGKVPEVVHLGVESGYDRLQQSAFIVQRGGDLRSELEEMAESAIDNTGHDVVPGQLEEKQDG